MMTTIIYHMPKVVKKALYPLYNLTKMLAEVTLTLRVKINLKMYPTSNGSQSILDNNYGIHTGAFFPQMHA